MVSENTKEFELRGGVAAITGAASGLGLEIARACAAAGMSLALCDIDADRLQVAVDELSRATPCIGTQVDVRREQDVKAFADRVFRHFGKVSVLFNNAGVIIARPLIETTLDDWKWLLDINLMGVIHGIGAFLPRLIAQDCESRVVNTSSVAGFLSVPGLSAYCVSKHAVVALSETLEQELRAQQAQVGVTILLPAFVPTQLARNALSRPSQSASVTPLSSAARKAEADLERAVSSGKLSAADVAGVTLAGVRARSHYVFTHPKIRGAIKERMAAVYSALESAVR